MSEQSPVRVIVLYPQPLDIEQFEQDYRAHLALLNEKLNMPAEKPYTITKMLPTPDGPAPYYLMFTLPFSSMKELGQTLNSPEMQEVAKDANRISSGGAPVVLVGGDTEV